MAIYRIGDDPEYAPQIAPTAWVAENATVLGRVRMGQNSSVWYGAVLRGDNDAITLGDRVNVQDGSVLHTDHGWPMTLGNDVSIGHLVMLHGCSIGEGTLVGIQSVVLNGAKIGRNCLVGAGSVVTEGKEFPDNSLILGSPAKVVRELSPEQVARMRMAAAYYVENAVRHRTQLKRVD